jgi:hypothetical protein
MKTRYIPIFLIIVSSGFILFCILFPKSNIKQPTIGRGGGGGSATIHGSGIAIGGKGGSGPQGGKGGIAISTDGIAIDGKDGE